MRGRVNGGTSPFSGDRVDLQVTEMPRWEGCYQQGQQSSC
jgi:hypothetical protein